MGVYLLISQREMKTVRANKEHKMYIRILENDDWIVEYDIENNIYRVGYFQDNHFVDEVWFDAGEWIPVSERLPEEYKYVLVTANEKHNKTIPDSVVMIGYYTYEQGWILNGYIDLVNLNVTAWMPLPEPYKAGE